MTNSFLLSRIESHSKFMDGTTIELTDRESYELITLIKHQKEMIQVLKTALDVCTKKVNNFPKSQKSNTKKQ
jgi:hypothetical protein